MVSILKDIPFFRSKNMETADLLDVAREVKYLFGEKDEYIFK